MQTPQAMYANVSLKHRLQEEILKNTMGAQESVSKQGRKFAKGEPSVQRDPLFDEIPKDTLDHMETENAQVVGRTRDIVGEEKENDENILSTEDVLSTDEQIKSTDEQRKGTEDHTKEGSATQATQTPTSTIFGDDETIAKFMLNMSQSQKAVSREKETGESKEEGHEEVKEEESKRKRKLGTRKKTKSRKKRFIQNTSEDDSEKENDELRLHLTIAPDEEKEVVYEIL
ncbi:hypothetical protein Tco_1309700 [Tanacetum coccineum]